jgi:H/ACA ribonucleoprotein complex subunit 4
MKLPFERKTTKILVRKQAKSNGACLPEDRPIFDLLDYGIINIDKPQGPTSHQVSAFVQKILGITKSGHSGTLDPNVTGCLPVALGRGTKVVQVLLNAGKEYVCIMHLHDDIPEKKVRETGKKLIGKITQMPPVKSAVKRQWRNRRIYYLDILEIDKRDVLFKVGCQAGTYIRKLTHDWGKLLGTAGHMAELRRTKAASFDESSIVSLYDLTDAYWYYKEKNDESKLRKLIYPIERACHHLGKVYVLDSTVSNLCNGANLHVPGISKVESEIQVDEVVAIMTLNNELIAIGKAKMVSKDMVSKEKGIAVITNKVFMAPGLYSKTQ